MLAATVVGVGLAACGDQANGSATRAGKPATRASRPAPRAASGAVHFAEVRLRVPAGNDGGTITGDLHVRLPRGWTAEVWARLPNARLEAWTPQGDLLVSEPDLGRVMELQPRRVRAKVPAQRVLISGLDDPQGLAFARDGRQEVLFVAETDQIDRYAWRKGGVGARKIIVSNLPDTAPAGSDNHTLKNVVVAPHDRIDVDLGSGSNASPPAPSDPPRASVVSYTFAGTGRRVVATGVRNGDGLSYAPDGTLWTAVNERDQIAYPFHRAYGGFADAYGQVIQAYVNNHPPDEVARLTDGRDLGWPYCDPDPDVRPGVAHTRLRYANLPFIDDEQTNPHGKRLNCRKLLRLNRGLPAHSAPLGFHFLEGSRLPARWTRGAVIAAHGSWDREPPRAPAVLWLPWESRTRTLGQPVILLGGLQAADGTRWGRPVDAVPGPDGALYVSDDLAGAVYRIVPSRPRQ